MGLVLTGAHDAASINRAHRMGAGYACKPDASENIQCFLDRCKASNPKRAPKVAAGQYNPAARRARHEGEARDEASILAASPSRDDATDTFVALYEQSKTADLFGFYAMARAAATIGRNGSLARLAERIGLCARTLRSYALVGTFIRPDDLRELSSFRDDAGNALSRRQLIHLAGVPRRNRSEILQTLRRHLGTGTSTPVKVNEANVSTKDPEDPNCIRAEAPPRQ